MHIVKQIIEKADIRLFFALWQPVAAVEYQFGFQRKKPRLAKLSEYNLRSLTQEIDWAKQTGLWQAALA